VRCTTCSRDLQAERVEQADRVGSHVGERVRRRGEIAGERRGQVGHGCIVEMGRLAHVAVVEADELQAAPGQLLAESIRPGDELRADAHDQQHRGRVRVAETLVGDVEAGRTDVREPLNRHGRAG
jgi:hypothetical protein